MRLVSYGPPQAEQPGVLLSETEIVPLAEVLRNAGYPPLDTNTILAFLPTLQPVIMDALARPMRTVSVRSTRLGPPVPRPQKIIVAGGNYRNTRSRCRLGMGRRR